MNCMFNWWALVHSSIVYLMAAFAECWLSKKAVIASKLSNFMLIWAIRRDICVGRRQKHWINQFLVIWVIAPWGRASDRTYWKGTISLNPLGPIRHDKPSIPETYPPKGKLRFDFQSFNRYSSPRPSRPLSKCWYWYICQYDVKLSESSYSCDFSCVKIAHVFFFSLARHGIHPPWRICLKRKKNNTLRLACTAETKSIF